MTHWQLYEGDCLELLPLFPDHCADVVLTDPPWPGANAKITWDSSPEHVEKLWARVVPHLERLADRIIVILGCTTNPRMLAEIQMPFCRVVCGRTIPSPRHGPILKDVELAYVFSRANYLSVPGSRVMPGNTLARFNTMFRGPDLPDHPCPRPPEFISYLVKWYTRPGSRILDPFAGAGTIGIEALKAGREFEGIEINPAYCEIARRSIKQAAQDGPLFEAAL